MDGLSGWEHKYGRRCFDSPPFTSKGLLHPIRGIVLGGMGDGELTEDRRQKWTHRNRGLPIFNFYHSRSTLYFLISVEVSSKQVMAAYIP
jgi:hypothetical protein